jgi:hypothetical protein
VAQVAVCSQINTKHINKVWAERRPVGFKRLNFVSDILNRKLNSIIGNVTSEFEEILRLIGAGIFNAVTN